MNVFLNAYLCIYTSRYYATATIEIPLPAMAVIEAVVNTSNQPVVKPVLPNTQPTYMDWQSHTPR